MSIKTLAMPEDAFVNMLNALPEETLVEIFWKTLLGSDISPLIGEEKEDVRKGIIEYEKGETIPWKDL